jgi:RNA polymerase sigma factor (sigma-70 family)
MPSTQETSSPSPTWSDGALVVSCLRGNEAAWNALVLKYGRLVYAIILNSGAAAGEEADVYQAVWLDVFNELSRLKKRDSLKAWISTVTRHKCYHWRLRSRRLPAELDENWAANIPDGDDLPPEKLSRIERDHELRDAVAALPPRCRQLLSELFLNDPPRPYAAIAKDLGLAEGSIGAQRSRCLERLKAELERRGVIPGDHSSD